MYLVHATIVLVFYLTTVAAAGYGLGASGGSDGSGGSGDFEGSTADTDDSNSVGSDDSRDDESDSTKKTVVVIVPLGCFPSEALVYTDTAAQPQKMMRHLQIGEQVLSMRNDGQVIYSPVMAFLHRESVENAAAYFVKLETEDGYTLRLTPDHLIFRNRSRGFTGVFAFTIEPGDFVYTTDVPQSERNPQGDTLKLSLVTSVSIVKGYGIYAPVTTGGTVIVDGVAASCYAGVADQELVHASFAPLRLMHRLMPTIVEADGDGLHWYPRMMLQFVNFARPLVAPLLTGKVHPAYSMILGDSSPMQMPIDRNYCNVK